MNETQDLEEKRNDLKSRLLSYEFMCLLKFPTTVTHPKTGLVGLSNGPIVSLSQMVLFSNGKCLDSLIYKRVIKIFYFI
jgi:hypothetical protein